VQLSIKLFGRFNNSELSKSIRVDLDGSIIKPIEIQRFVLIMIDIDVSG
jgi:hypothetical protein